MSLTINPRPDDALKALTRAVIFPTFGSNISENDPAQLKNSLVKEFVVAGHKDLSKVQSMLAEYPNLIYSRYDWGNGDFEEAIEQSCDVYFYELAYRMGIDKIHDFLEISLSLLRPQAGNQKSQYKVDFTYQYEFAKLAKENGVNSYFLVSSTGANAKSSIFYPRMKGNLEGATKELGFQRTVLIQPSVLQGDRENNRFGEKFGALVINGLGKIIPTLKKYRGIHGREVAAAMNRIYKSDQKETVEVFKLDELF